MKKTYLIFFSLFVLMACSEESKQTASSDYAYDDIEYADELTGNITKVIDDSDAFEHLDPPLEVSDVSILVERKLQEEEIARKIKIGDYCRLRSGREIIVIDDGEKYYKYLYFPSESCDKPPTEMNAQKEYFAKIIKRIVDDHSDQQPISEIRSELGEDEEAIGRDCVLKNGCWILVYGFNNGQYALIYQNTGQKIMVKTDALPLILRRVRKIGSTN